MNEHPLNKMFFNIKKAAGYWSVTSTEAARRIQKYLFDQQYHSTTAVDGETYFVERDFPDHEIIICFYTPIRNSNLFLFLEHEKQINDYKEFTDYHLIPAENTYLIQNFYYLDLLFNNKINLLNTTNNSFEIICENLSHAIPSQQMFIDKQDWLTFLLQCYKYTQYDEGIFHWILFENGLSNNSLNQLNMI